MNPEPFYPIGNNLELASSPPSEPLLFVAFFLILFIWLKYKND